MQRGAGRRKSLSRRQHADPLVKDRQSDTKIEYRDDAGTNRRRTATPESTAYHHGSLCLRRGTQARRALETATNNSLEAPRRGSARWIAGRRLDRRIQSSRWIAQEAGRLDDAYVDRVFRLRIFGRRLGGKRRAESHLEDLSMNELAGTAASHGTGRNTIDGAGLSRITQGLPWACPRVAWRQQAKTAFVR